LWSRGGEALLRYLRDPIWQFIGVVVAIATLFAMIVRANPALVQRWWQAGLLGAVALIALVALVQFWRPITRGFRWVSHRAKGIYLRMLWQLVVRPARDHLGLMVLPDAGGVPQKPTGVYDRRRDKEPEPIDLSGATMKLPEELGGVELVRIPAGEFSMGGWLQQVVFVDTCYISKYPITNAQYKYFIEDEGHPSPADWTGGRNYPAWKADHPVVAVSWHDARAYCAWLSRKTGFAFRLPTEAEWEKAAQGPDRRTYPWGDSWNKYHCACAEREDSDTVHVGRDSPEGDSRFGVSDMAGNVWEWTSSLLKDLPYDPSDGREDPKAQGDRVLRGGSFKDGREQVSCAHRIHNQPEATGEEIGFRIAVSPE